MDSIINRRTFFKVAATGVTGCMVSPMELFPQGVSTPPVTVLGTAKYVIFVLLPGAPSQTDTFDLKVGSWTPPDFQPAPVNGTLWPCGLLPSLAYQHYLGRFSVIRSCQSSALVHPLLQTWNQIARNPASATGKIAPNVGSIVALETEPQRRPNQPLPGFIALNGGGSLQGQGYLAGKYAPFDVAPNAGGLANLAHPDGPIPFTTRYNTLQMADEAVARNSPYGKKFEEMADYYSSARTMMYNPSVTSAFQIAAGDVTKYGNSGFGNACVTARNLIWSDLGVRYIQISLGGWDNHQNIYVANGGIRNPARQFDVGLANLIADLSLIPGSRGTLLDDTLIVAKGEFGRTVGPITAQQGRDHYFVHSALVAGGGIKGGRVLGKTTSTGAFVEEPGWSAGRPVYSEDVAATIYSAMGINYRTMRHDDPLGRGFEYVPTTGTTYIGQPVLEMFS